MKKTALRNLSLTEMEDMAEDLGLQRYRGRQIFPWVYGKGIDSVDMMTNLSREHRALLSQKVYISRLIEIKRQISSDGTEKFLFALEDDHRIESVLIPEEERLTLCISTQVGCGMGCTFCLTGKRGLIRNLKSSDIINQFLTIQKNLPGDKWITNIVFMGMGEPLANYKNTIKAIEILTHPHGIAFSARKITLSTSGLIPQIKRLGESALRPKLSITVDLAGSFYYRTNPAENYRYPLPKL